LLLLFLPGNHLLHLPHPLHPPHPFRAHNSSATTSTPSLLLTPPFIPTLFLTHGRLFRLVLYIVGYCPYYDLHLSPLLYITYVLILTLPTLPRGLTPLLIVCPPLLTLISSNLPLCPSLPSLWTVTHPSPRRTSTSTLDFPHSSIISSPLVLSRTRLSAQRPFCRYLCTIHILFLSTHTLVLLLLFRLSSSCIPVLTNCPPFPLFPPALETNPFSAALDAIPWRTHITFSSIALPLTTYAANTRPLYGPRPCGLLARLLYHPLSLPSSPISSAHSSAMAILGLLDNLAIIWDFYLSFIQPPYHTPLRQSPNVSSCVLPIAVTLMPSGWPDVSGALSAASIHRAITLLRGVCSCVNKHLAIRPLLLGLHWAQLRLLTYRTTFFTYSSIDFTLLSSISLYFTLLTYILLHLAWRPLFDIYLRANEVAYVYVT